MAKKAKKKQDKFIDLGRVESEKFEPSAEVRNEFDEAAQLGSAGQLIEKVLEHTDSSPILSGGDIDAAWEDASVGEECRRREPNARSGHCGRTG